MISQTCLLLTAIVGYALASLAFYQAKVGERVVLDLGAQVVTWKRERDRGVPEFIKHCGPTEKELRCTQFVTKDNQPAQPESNAHIDANGALIIDPMKATDVGQYSDADAKPIETKLPDGSISSVLPPHIQLELKE
ncbi:unnamed protein product [Heligmosomoides polygyrus]|uniref:DUF4333 domain-containing protein n=1 Tax=Heligmosomoides polygyrus TaxID=6339 RepID=A0A183FJM9_HELPZ|nr:unnamed protein product [Heligmosomoides polygyrus]